MQSKVQRLTNIRSTSTTKSTRAACLIPRATTSPATASKRVRYSKRPDKGDLFFYTSPPPPEVGKVTNLEPDEVVVDLQDLRLSNSMTLERNGFEMVKFVSGQGLDWHNEEQVKEVYYAELDSLLKKVTGATRVYVMGHGFRRGKVQKEKLITTKLPGPEDPATFTHVDFTEISAARVLKQHMGEEAEQLSKKPWGIVQVWRPKVGPVQDSPLGLVDAATFSAADAMSVNLHTPHAPGGVHKVTFVAHNPSHKWYYTSGMQTDEAYVFVNYDSRDDGRAKFTPHGSIADSSVPQDAPQRQSIEARALVFWG